jgi:hypothetical protein
MKQARRIVTAGSGGNADRTRASARPVTPPPQGFSRGCDGSSTAHTRRIIRYAAHAPAGAPTIAMSWFTGTLQRQAQHLLREA